MVKQVKRKRNQIENGCAFDDIDFMKSGSYSSFLHMNAKEFDASQMRFALNERLIMLSSVTNAL